MPLEIEIQERDSQNSVYNVFNDWTNKVRSAQKETELLTREVLIEKHSFRDSIIAKWENAGLLKGIKHKHIDVTRLMESQASHLLREPIQQPIFISSRKPHSKIKKVLLKIKSFFIFIWNKFFKKSKKDNFPSLLPLGMQISARTIGLDLVPVQPMSAPTSQLFYFDFVYDVEREDVYNRKVIIEKFKEQKPDYTRYQVPNINTNILIDEWH